MTAIFKIITTTPCPKCDATKRRFKRHDIPYESVAKEDAEDLVEEARSSGATSFPIVLAPGGVDWWSDYRIDKIDAWGKALAWEKTQAKEEHDEPREPVG